MATEPFIFNNRLLAVSQDSGLTAHVSQSTNDFLVPVHKAIQRIRDAHLPAKLLHQLLRPPKVMSRYPGVQMVDRLELQPAVQKIQPLRTLNVHGGPQHLLRERLVDAQVGGAHGEMAQGDLDVEGAGDHVADHDEEEPVAGVRNRFVDDPVAVPGPEEDVAGELEPPVPPRRPFLRA